MSIRDTARRLPVAACLGLAACTSYTTFTPAGGVPIRAAKPAASLKLYFDLDEPKCKYHVVGFYESGQPGGSAVQLEPLREDAASRGFDGLVGLSCARPLDSDFGKCTAKAYVCE